MIMYDDDSLDFVHYVSDFFMPTQELSGIVMMTISLKIVISLRVYTRESHKKTSKKNQALKTSFLWFISEQTT